MRPGLRWSHAGRLCAGRAGRRAARWRGAARRWPGPLPAGRPGPCRERGPRCGLRGPRPDPGRRIVRVRSGSCCGSQPAGGGRGRCPCPGPGRAGRTGGGVVLAAGPGPGDGRGRGAGWRDQPDGRARGELLRFAGLDGGARSPGGAGHRPASAAISRGEPASPAATSGSARPASPAAARSRLLPWPGPGVPGWPSRPAAAPGSVRSAHALAVRHGRGGVHCIIARTRCSRIAPGGGSPAPGPGRAGTPAPVRALAARRRVTRSGVAWMEAPPSPAGGRDPDAVLRAGGRTGVDGYQTGYRPP